MDSQKVLFVFVAICAASALGKPFTIDVLESSDLFFPKESELVKRTTAGSEGSNDVAELSIPKISLSSLIENIESGLVQTALSAGDVAGSSNAQVEDVTPNHSVHKRSPIEDAVETTTAASSNETVLVQKSEKVLASEAVPAHVVIDRVTVYKAPVSGAVLFPTFHLQETITSAETGEVLAEVKEDRYVVEGSNNTSSSESTESTESSESSESSEKSEEKGTSTSTGTPIVDTTIVDSSSSTVTEETSTASTTTSVSVDDKQTVEEDLKEKVAEVEAEPVILTARV